ncbi:MAG: capsular polysaccharide biosynthesis protein [Oscillospiraceae bacterium]|nr:capsular polysaccharide biosynthesis protein [Oscillospiraceae bacterium]
MLTEHHCHILPQIDDGSSSLEMSLEMIKLMRSQGVERIIATPHFYAHREHNNVKHYLEKRQNAYKKIIQAEPKNADILLGAEIAIEHGISKLPDIDKLRIADTNYILLELPYAGFQHWYLDEITDLSYEHHLTPIIAHIHRYLEYYSKAEYEEVLKLDAIFQINNEAFGNFKEKRFVKSLIKEGYPYLFGSDAHNISDRKPNWDFLIKKLNYSYIENSEKIL